MLTLELPKGLTWADAATAGGQPHLAGHGIVLRIGDHEETLAQFGPHSFEQARAGFRKMEDGVAALGAIRHEGRIVGVLLVHVFNISAIARMSKLFRDG